jgi:hypothetical protein
MGGSPTVREVGRLGGLQTLRRWGRNHFVQAGRLGQEVMARRYTSNDRRRWGKLGGRPRKIRLTLMGEKGEPNGRRHGEPACGTPSPPQELRPN